MKIPVDTWLPPAPIDKGLTMKLPVEIRFRNLRRSALIEDDIRQRAERLNTYCGDITSCRVLVEVPHRHHEKGNPFHVRINLTVPDDDIAVTRASTLHASAKDEHAWVKALEVDAMRIDVQLVVREAFDAVRRRLQDYARRRRGAVKAHERGVRGVAVGV
jgi:ribosome-associated translation inhibitor RaiA